MAMLFERTLDGRASWAAVFQDREAFEPLVHYIYRKEGLTEAPLRGLTPGTNAVFRCGDTVCKVFAPRESGFYNERDFVVEAAALVWADAAGIAVSELVAKGIVEDRYAFAYMILRFVDGVEANDAIHEMNVEKRGRFGARMRTVCARLNRSAGGLLPVLDLRARAIGNPSLARLPEGLRAQLQARAALVDMDEVVLCHGDLTGENVLVADGEPVLLDFADSVEGPACYELPALVFELLRCEPAMVRGFLGGDDPRAFVGSLLDGLSLHAFGVEILEAYRAREGLGWDALSTLEALEGRLLSAWKG